ncbi:MAG: UDP-3-O-acyl-N-acetylglucosamine deacetylase [Candidatus Omnitrophica bacterium]|nr:UDP-3-O-acyl-N-acetylglucosamine deacetylase [Candidatus Omnitrophota bacterium]MBU4488239.1 UDP-3-O-acyl-N-acetylglucosamine deacetylase [Candidatus Omnitrophota bacterium]MCG2704687.1 UDP-3-O-acyl-N-acetylglucosamine deacetylase [Candidatus Omnitrophota bacterium]
MRLQRTIKNPVTLEGRGIHTGSKVKITIKSAPPDEGIHFVRKDLKTSSRLLADVSNLRDYSNKLRCTSLGKGSAGVHTIEHLLAALYGLSVDNADIEIDNAEPPALDGSASEYAAAIKMAGSVEQDRKRKELLLKDIVWEEMRGSFLIALPYAGFKISYLLHYSGANLSSEYAEFSFDSEKEKEKIFLDEIAPARTFCLYKEVFLIKALGLAKGVGLGNALVIKDGKPIKNKFRLKDEPARHKILDLLGDLALLNKDIKAHIIGIKSGHSLNRKLLKKLERGI